MLEHTPMQRAQLEHLIRAAAAVTNEYELVIVGSQSILGAHPSAPDELLRSMEADMYPLHRPELADLIDGAIGEHSPFHDSFGYYAQGVGPETATLPKGWQKRLVKVQGRSTDLKIGLCLEPHDLAAAKLAAGRPKDRPFVQSMLDHGLIKARTLRARVASLPVSTARQHSILNWLATQGGSPRPKTKR
jgi:hypothetical protein